MNWLRRPYRSTQRQHSTSARPPNRVRLLVERLETRLAPASVFVVPLSQAADSTHLYDLGDALTAAGAGGLVTIEPGAVPLPSDGTNLASVTERGLTVQGDPNVPASVLAPFNFLVAADNVRLTNLNLGAVQLGTTRSFTTIS